MREFKTLQQQFWGRHLWARGYFVASSGNVTDEVILEYIKNQDKERTDDNFQIGREWHLSVRLGFNPLNKLSPFRRLVNWLDEVSKGKVKVTVTANREIKSIQVDHSMLQDAEELEDYLVLTLSKALKRANEINEREMAAAAKNGLPDILGLDVFK